VLQRLKHGANPVVLASYGPSGHRRALNGEGKPLSLNDACNFGYVHRQSVLDLDVELQDSQGRTMIARVVCVPFQGEDRYYLTSLPRDTFSAYDIAEIYRLRWEVELFFRNWKGGVRLDQVRRLSHPASLQLAITASMLAALLARDISARLTEISDQLDSESESPPAEAFSPRSS
jgi:IS4 transposase